jgi:O-antigen/teichoic acid export membrane protein
MIYRLTRNSLWLLSARIGTQFGLAFFTILVARGLGSFAFGEYAFIASIVVIGNVVTTFGTDMLLIREIAATDELSGLFPALTIQVFLSAIFIVVIMVVSSYLPNLDGNATAALRIYSFALLPLAFFTVFTSALRGKQRMVSYAFLNLALMILQLVAVLWLKLRGGGLIDLAILLLLVQVIGTVIAGFLCKFQIQSSSQSWFDDMGQLWRLIRTSAPIAVLGILGIIYQRLSLILLPSLSGLALTGSYSAAARIVEAAKIGHVAVYTALFPIMSQVMATDKLNWFRAFRLPLLLLLGGAIIFSISLSWLAQPLVSILYGNQYDASVTPLRVLTWILIPYTINSFLSLAFLARGDESVLVLSLTAGIFILAILTVWWEPIVGIYGAAWAALCAETLQSIVLMAWGVHQYRVPIIKWDSS